MTRTRATLLAVPLALLLFAVPALAQKHLMVEGMLRTGGGQVLDGTFDITYSLYADPGDAAAVWEETHFGHEVTAGFFQARLGTETSLDPSLFTLHPAMWLGVTLAGQPELPRTPLETDPYAFQAHIATTAQSLTCTGCVEPGQVGFNYASSATTGGAAELAETALVASTAHGLDCTGCVTVDALAAGVLEASNVIYDDTVTKLGATTVQSAIEALKVLIGQGGGPSGVGNEGAGSIIPYTNQWGLPSYGIATEYLHLLTPLKAKIVTYLYGGKNTGFSSSNNLVVTGNYNPNKYAGAAKGNAGESTVDVINGAIFNIADHILIHQTVGPNAGQWEVNVVQSVTNNTLSLAKPLNHTYLSDDNANGPEAQVVLAASFNQLDVINGGNIYPSKSLSASSTSDFSGGIVYIRAQTINVKAGGKIHADGLGYKGTSYTSNTGYPGDSECGPNPSASKSANCSGGGGGYGNSSSCNYNWYGGGGGGNKTAGDPAATPNSGGQGGQAKGDANATTLHFGGAGGGGRSVSGGAGGGIVVLGAKTIIVESGGTIQSNGLGGGSYSSCQFPGAGGGAGGSVVLFAEHIENKGTIAALGGPKGTGHGTQRNGGDGGEGWIYEMSPVPGVVNQSFATGVQIWVDGVNVTPSVGDPNGKGLPHYDPVAKHWGATGTDPWSTGQLDLTNVANWTLGEHKVEFRETGGAGGDLKAYTYVIYPFSSSQAPENDTCAAPKVIDPNDGPVVVSGTTEDTMGKLEAVDDSSQANCGGEDGPDVVYQIDLAERGLINVVVTAPFSAKTYLRKAACADGDLVVCADSEFSTNPLEPGTYYLWIDSDSAEAKGDFKLGVSVTPAPLPPNDTCAEAIPLVFTGPDGKGIAVHSSTTLYALDQYKGLCQAAKSGGPDVVYQFNAPTGAILNVDLTADGFESIIYVKHANCETGSHVSCSATGNFQIQGLEGGTYYLFIDGAVEKEWGPYELSIELK